VLDIAGFEIFEVSQWRLIKAYVLSPFNTRI
jgi:hypothetical protein